MSSTLDTLRPPAGSRKRRKRIGRGPGSGSGKTAGRGQKGQKSRTGKGRGVKRGFEGGQMPLQRRLPKRGFTNPFRRPAAVVNLRDLTVFEPGSTLEARDLRAVGLARNIANGVKVLGVGDVDRPLHLRVFACSEMARQKIVAAGGTVELVGRPPRSAVKASRQSTAE
jgi:large subunit ribosomal protein L15